MNTAANQVLAWRKYIPTDENQGLQTGIRAIEAKGPSEPVTERIGFVFASGIILAIITVLSATYFNWHQLQRVRDILQDNPFTHGMLWLGGIFLIINLAALVWRAVLFWWYSPTPEVDDFNLPRCTVIVPAYNESRQVLTTLQSIAASDYPSEKLQIIAIDDGSQDDTWFWIKKAGKLLKGRVTALKQPENRGKRHALYRGFLNSRGEILVTIDSDSTVDSQTLRRLMSPFVCDRGVGAVAGNVRVLNQSKGLIPKMLDIVFVYSFDFIRASQSMVNTVMCTPGALSAYRKKVVMKVLEEWLHQTFGGRSAKIGEDRAMTNLILREGYDVLFQQNAKVYTNVPIRYTNLCKMFLRWARSNIRETLVMSRFSFRRFRAGGMLGARINLLLSWLTLIKSQIFIFLTWGLIIWHPLIIGLNVMLGVIISSSLLAGLYLYRHRSPNALLAYAYQIFWFLTLFWITPYATLTAYRSEWLTRDIAPPSQSPPFWAKQVTR